MRKYLISEKGNFYKANLHCHSTLSDGKLTVEELKKLYTDGGYSIVAFTDHGAFLPHNDLTDDKFLALNGYEIDVSEKEATNGCSRKTCHFCLIALDKNRTAQKICYTSKHFEKNKDSVDVAEGEEVRSLEYSPESISALMKEAAEDGFFVTYNHPAWSLETSMQYCNYHGMRAMEIINYGCVVEGFEDYNERAYDEMLREGRERIFCIATDDNHNRYPYGNPRCDSCGGFTMIKAEELSYEKIAEALVKGDFYASEGAEIKELWYEDGKVHVACSDASKIVCLSGRRKTRVVFAEDVPLTEVEFDIVPEDVYVRITVHGKDGKKAYTSAYFVDKLIENN